MKKFDVTKDQRGIALVLEIILVAAVLTAVGFVGYKAYQVKQEKTPTQEQATQKEEPKETAKLKEESKVSYKTYSKNNITFEYPDNWKLNDQQSFPSVESPDFKREGLQAMSILAGAFVEVSQTDIPQTDRTADNFQSWGNIYHGDTKNAKTVTVNGRKAIQFEARHGDASFGWDATLTIFFRKNGTRVVTRYGYKLGQKQANLSAYDHLLNSLKYD